jgi:hypothetical protein
MDTNLIPEVQNRVDQLRLLKARRHMYSRGKALLRLQMVLTIGIPLMGAVGALFVPSFRGPVALVSLIIAILDTTILDRVQKSIRVSAAKAQEQFDTTVLELPWDSFTAGRPLTPEHIHDAANQYDCENGNEGVLRDWYPVAVGTIPIHMARIICQRTNLWYDSQLRRRYGYGVLGLCLTVLAILLTIGIVEDLTLISFVVAILAPASPVIIWSVREFCNEHESANRLDQLREAAEALWDRARKGECGPDGCADLSRQFQNAIYSRRCDSPLIFDWIYWALRPRLETQMNKGAEQLIRELRA